MSLSLVRPDGPQVNLFVVAASVANATAYNFISPQLLTDSHGAWNGTTYTVPVSGLYELNAKMQFTANQTAGQFYSMSIKKNAADILVETEFALSTINSQRTLHFSPGQLRFVAGDAITIGQTGTNFNSVTPSAESSWFSIKRIGD